jgi:hypothetical protein
LIGDWVESLLPKSRTALNTRPLEDPDKLAVTVGAGVLAYDLFRLSPSSNEAAPILSGEHEIWFGTSDAYQLRPAPDELLMELRDRCMGCRHSQSQACAPLDHGRESNPDRRKANWRS